MSKETKPVWHMTETDWDKLISAVKADDLDEDCYGSLHIGSIAADIVSRDDQVFADLYIKGFDGYSADDDGIPYAPADNEITIRPLRFKTFGAFKTALLRKVDDLATNSSLKMSEPLIEGFTDDGRKLLAGANGVWT